MKRILNEDSILRRLPRGLDAGQRNWLEGIRYSIEIVDLAYHRLCAALGTFGEPQEGSKTPSEIAVASDQYTSVLLDAWTVVDTTWRLKRFVLDSRPPSPPGPPMESREPKEIRLRDFAEATRPLKQLRDGFQHLDNKVANTAALRQPIWGYLNWVNVYPRLNRVHSCCLVPCVPGLGTSTFELINPVGKEFQAHVDYITLKAFEATADLSRLHRLVGDVAQQLHDALNPHLSEHPYGGDAFVIVMPVGPTAQDNTGSLSLSGTEVGATTPDMPHGGE